MSQEAVFFSVVIPLYNKARHIRDTIQSVLEQTHQEFEIIVVDDGSTDGGGEIVTQINDPRIKLIRQENGGVSKARNTGIENSSHELIAFLDGDDTWLPNHLETLKRMTTNFPDAAMYATSYLIKSSSGEKVTTIKSLGHSSYEGLIDYFKHAAIDGNIIWSSAVVIRKNIFESVGSFAVGVRMGEDLDMWMRVALKYPVCFSTEITAIYQLEADNRACQVFKVEDIHSPILNKWFEYRLNDDFKTYIRNTQLDLLCNLIIHGHGNLVRNYLIQIANFHNILSVIVCLLASFLSKKSFNTLKKIKNLLHGIS